jgi:hypothetical protein
MRAKEFIINVPISIHIDSDGELSVGPEEKDEKSDVDTDAQPTMVPPLQQDIEIKKANAGKNSTEIQDLLSDEPEA